MSSCDKRYNCNLFGILSNEVFLFFFFYTETALIQQQIKMVGNDFFKTIITLFKIKYWIFLNVSQVNKSLFTKYA